MKIQALQHPVTDFLIVRGANFLLVRTFQQTSSAMRYPRLVSGISTQTKSRIIRGECFRRRILPRLANCIFHEVYGCTTARVVTQQLNPFTIDRVELRILRF